MTAPIFVDTNIFIYARDPRDAEKQGRAAEWISNFWRDRTGRTSVQVLSEYYYNVTGRLTPKVASADAWDDVEALFEWRPHPIDAALLERARDIEQRWRLNWWDSMIVAAAQLQGCAILLTEDLQDGSVYGGVTRTSAGHRAALAPELVGQHDRRRGAASRLRDPADRGSAGRRRVRRRYGAQSLHAQRQRARRSLRSSPGRRQPAPGPGQAAEGTDGLACRHRVPCTAGVNAWPVIAEPTGGNGVSIGPELHSVALHPLHFSGISISDSSRCGANFKPNKMTDLLFDTVGL